MAKSSGKITTLTGIAKRFAEKVYQFATGQMKSVKNADLASNLAGTTDKKSKEYKAAMRNVQRWKKGTQKPSAKSSEKIAKFIKSKPDLLAKFVGPVTVTMVGTMQYSSDTRYREITESLSASEAEAFFALASENREQAAEFFLDDVYGAPGMIPFDDVRVTIEG